MSTPHFVWERDPAQKALWWQAGIALCRMINVIYRFGDALEWSEEGFDLNPASST